ncbi:MAG: protein-L-isoaspartate O-methyltransferase family protein [Nocardioidaceae bacterium]
MDGYLRSAFEAIRREDFLTDDQREYVAEDRPLPIGYQQTNSQPTTVRQMLELLSPERGNRVLDVGSGSGWTTALLGNLTGPTGQVWGVELVPELAEWGGANVARYDMPWVTVVLADPGQLGLPTQAPFDRILVSAQARELPRSLTDQLGVGGRMVIPVHGRLQVVDRQPDGQLDVRRVGHYAFVPLR